MQVGLCGVLLSLVLSLSITQMFLMAILQSRRFGGACLGPTVQFLALYELRFISFLWAEEARGVSSSASQVYRSSRAKSVGHTSRGVN